MIYSIELILEQMSRGDAQSDDAIGWFVEGVTSGVVSRPQAAAWLAFAYARTLSSGETVALTRAMAHSGGTMSWGEGPRLIDKHSTGGVGDKVSLILAPLWAELGMRVPMISGRGLGHTGGTLDKLESIPGYRTDLSESELRQALDSVGCFISGQTVDLAPADRILYGLRDETSTVASVPLIVASILSKKLAEGTERLILDVKVGSGGFMPDLEKAKVLGAALVKVARGAGLDCDALLTPMDSPLGRAVGNGLEVIESIETLKGGGPQDLIDVTLALADHKDAANVLRSGAAYERFCQMVEIQGGDCSAFEDYARLGLEGTTRLDFVASRPGIISEMDAGGIGRAALDLGAGRTRADEPVDHGVGLLLQRTVGDSVNLGDSILTVVHRDQHGLEQCLARLKSAVKISEKSGDISQIYRL